jgi:hypothetical protein
MIRTIVALVFISLVGCPSVASCERPAAPKDPDELVARVRALAADESWSALYDALSARRRESVTRVGFILGFSSQRVPPPHDYRIVDVIVKGRYAGALVDPANADRAIVYYSYAEPGKPRLLASVLVLREEGAWKVDGPAE